MSFRPPSLLAWCCGLGWLAGAATSSPAGVIPEPVVLTSSSKQFVVRGLHHPAGTGVSASGSTLVILDPTTLIVTCERVRQSLQQELGLRGEWKGRIEVEIHPIQHDREEIVVISRPTTSGCNYLVLTPDEVDGPCLLRTLVGLLLAEYSSRGARERSVELPPWLAPGVAGQLETASLSSLILERGQAVVRDRGAQESLTGLRSRLRAGRVLSADRLNWPEPEDFEGDKAESYQASAQLFVRELLRLSRGRDNLRRMLELLPQHLNWQLAFLSAFGAHFSRMVEVEKWWSMAIVHFTGQSPSPPLAAPAVWQRLNQILFTPVQVRLSKADLPHASYESLQGLVRDLPLAQQQGLLRQKTAHLRGLLRQAPPALVPLLEAYGQTLENHLRDSERTVRDTGSRTVQPLSFRVLQSDTVARLDRLDAKRVQLALSLGLEGSDQSSPPPLAGEASPPLPVPPNSP